jgi:hypothetical protein
MRLNKTAAIGVAVFALLSGTTAFAAADAQGAKASPAGEAPSLFFPEKSFEFQPVIEGLKVVHDFVVLNRGGAPLVIENVRTG